MRIRRYIYCLAILSICEIGAAIVINRCILDKDSDDKKGKVKSQMKYEGLEMKETNAPNIEQMPEKVSFLSEQAIVTLTEKVDKSYFEDALFVGDSRVVSFRDFSGIENGFFVADSSFSVDNFSQYVADNMAETENSVSSIYNNLKFRNYGKIYIEIGLNDLVSLSQIEFEEKYNIIVEHIRILQPSAIIYLQPIIYIEESVSDELSRYNNTNITIYNESILNVAMKNAIYYINVNEAVSNIQTSSLNKEAGTDGINLNDEYCEKWLDYLCTHTVQ